jgi:hypothetical protein
MPRNANPGATHLLAFAAVARGGLLLLLAALLVRFGASDRGAPAGDAVGALPSAARIGMEPPFDANASAWSTLRTMHAFVLWFDEAVIGRDGD